MEIKIVCDCGTKFKFDVEPIHGRMPAPVNCPHCGAEGTAQANRLIEAEARSSSPQVQSLEGAEVQGSTAVGAPVRIGSGAAAAPPMAPVAGGLRISRPAGPQMSEQSAASVPAPVVASIRPMQTARVAKPKSQMKQVLASIVVVIGIIFGAWRVGSKWSRRLNLVAKIASAVGQASVDKGANGSEDGAKNLWYENCAILFVRHSNHMEVAEACKAFWKDNLHKKLTALDSNREYQQAGEYELIPARNGYVRLLAAHDWPVQQHEALAQYLSQKFGTIVFEWRDESFADTYHFGVYDQGTRKFHAQMDVKIKKDDAEEIVTTEGNDFAIANGYKPGPEGFKEFNVLDADKITQRLGMKLWDEPEGTELKGMLLKEI